MALAVGFYLPDMMNANDLSDKWDLEKPDLKDRISIYKANTISLWFAIYILFVAIASAMKGIVLNWKVNQLSIIIVAFSIAAFIRLSNTSLVSRKFL